MILPVPDKRAYLGACVAGAYTAAVAMAFVPVVYARFMAVITDFSLGAIFGLLGLIADFFISAIFSIPETIMGLLGGIPGMIAGYAVVRRLRQKENNDLWRLPLAGAGVGAANGAIAAMLWADVYAAAVFAGFTLAGALTVFYLRRMDRERGHYN